MSDFTSTRKTFIELKCAAELARGAHHLVIPLQLDLYITLALIGNLQLALRHPQNTGPTATIAREIIDSLIGRMEEAGFPAHAELSRLGYQPGYDDDEQEGRQ